MVHARTTTDLLVFEVECDAEAVALSESGGMFAIVRNGKLEICESIRRFFIQPLELN